jgi:magnesium chelatase subunit ChlD-like protein
MAPRSMPAPRGRQAAGRWRKALRGDDSALLHWPRTLLAKRNRPLARAHLRYRKTATRAGILHCFVIDCSGSMLAGQQLALAQGALQQLHHRAYQQRADIALVTYAGDDAVVQMPPTAARPFNALQIHPLLPTLRGGGGTPLGAGIARADALLAANRRRKPLQHCWLWLFSDGRSTEQPLRPAHADVLQIVDCERQAIALQRCRALADNWRADYQTLDHLIEHD